MQKTPHLDSSFWTRCRAVKF